VIEYLAFTNHQISSNCEIRHFCSLTPARSEGTIKAIVATNPFSWNDQIAQRQRSAELLQVSAILSLPHCSPNSSSGEIHKALNFQEISKPENRELMHTGQKSHDIG